MFYQSRMHPFLKPLNRGDLEPRCSLIADSQSLSRSPACTVFGAEVRSSVHPFRWENRSKKSVVPQNESAGIHMYTGCSGNRLNLCFERQKMQQKGQLGAQTRICESMLVFADAQGSKR